MILKSEVHYIAVKVVDNGGLENKEIAWFKSVMLQRR